MGAGPPVYVMRRRPGSGISVPPRIAATPPRTWSSSIGDRPNAAALRASLDYDFRDRLPEIERPTLIVWGRNDRIVPVGGAYRYEQLIPNSRRLVFEDTGHVPMIERPALFNRLLEDFLAE